MADVKLKNVILSYPDIFVAKSVNGGAPRFSANFIFEPGHPAEALMQAEIEAMTAAKWPKGKPKGMKEPCLLDGNDKDYNGYEDRLYVSAGSKSRPGLVDRRGNPVTEEDNIFYPGCVVNAVVNVWAQDNSWGKRINAELMAIQFVRDGEPLGGRVPVKTKDAFEDLGDDDWDDNEKPAAPVARKPAAPRRSVAEAFEEDDIPF